MKSVYIKRRLLEKEQYYQYGEHGPFSTETSLDLYNLIIQGTKRTILLGDAGYGKSTELTILFRRFYEEKNPDFVPIYISLDTYTDENIEEYIKLRIGEDSITLLDYDRSKLLFLFDEFDRVRHKGKTEKKLKNFMEQYYKSAFVIACRTNFYSGQFADFKNVVLLPFDLREIKLYTKSVLRGESDNFLQHLSRNSLLELAKNPFFLNHLVKIYQKDKQIPQEHALIFSRIVSLSLEADTGRLAEYDLRQTYPFAHIEEDLMYMSIVMETFQKNFASVEEFTRIFPDSRKQEIIPRLSLIKKSFFKDGDVFQFQHNNFQEFLAARKLKDRDLATILDFISYTEEKSLSLINEIAATVLRYVKIEPFGIRVGKIVSDMLYQLIPKFKRINKINPSWTNTVTFLCQLRQNNDFFDYLSKYEPEFAFKFEVSKMDYRIREKLFKIVFEKYTKRKIWLRQEIEYNEMANFAKTRNIYDYLLDFARSKEHFVYRYNAIQMLGRMEGMGDDQLQTLLIQYANNKTENVNVRHISLYALSWLSMNDAKTIETLKELKNSNDDMVLSGFYYLIKESAFVENYIDILLEGISKATDSTVFDMRWYVEQGIANVKSAEGIRKIARYFTGNCDQLRGLDISSYVGKMIENAINAYESNNSLYNDIKELTVILDKSEMMGAVSKTTAFYKKTGTVFRFFKDIYALQNKDDYPLLAFVADEACIEFLISEYQKNRILEEDIRDFIYSLASQNEKNFNRFLTIINTRTGKFPPAPPRDYEKEQKLRTERKIQIIFDIAEFMKETERIFTEENRKELDYDDLRKIRLNRWRKEKYNDFVINELLKYFEGDKGKKWTLANLKADIRKWDYEWFKVTRIFDLLRHNVDAILSDDQKTVIENFCLKSVTKVDFRTALKPGGVGTSTSELAVILWYFLRRLNLDYPETVLLDMLSFDWLEDHFRGIEYLVDRLSFSKVKKRVLANLKEGVIVNQVLSNHINFCKKYRLHEARELLFNLVRDPNVNTHNRLLALETVVIFGRATELLEGLLNTEELEIFRHVAEILIADNNKKCIKKLVQRLYSENEEFALASAVLLIRAQNIKGIRFYANYIKKEKILTLAAPDRSPLMLIETTKALPILLNLLRFYYEHKHEASHSRFGTLGDVVISVLKNIAQQDYVSVSRVLRNLKKFIGRYSSRLQDVNFLYIAYDDIEKAFFSNYSLQPTFKDAKAKVDKLLYSTMLGKRSPRHNGESEL